jgi:hypothetical protein
LLKEIQNLERDREGVLARPDRGSPSAANNFLKAGQPGAGPVRSGQSGDVLANPPDKAARPKGPLFDKEDSNARPKNESPDRGFYPARPKDVKPDTTGSRDGQDYPETSNLFRGVKDPDRGAITASEQEVEAALKALREARDAQARQRAAEALERAVKKLREELNPSVDRPAAR